MKVFLRMLFVAALTLGVLSSARASEKVTDYTPVFIPFQTSDNAINIAVRKFRRGPKMEFLVVDAQTFETQLTGVDPAAAPKAADMDAGKTPFMKALNKYAAPQEGFQNHGIKTAEHGKGFFLTVDLCPSRKSLDKKLFIATASATKNNAPVAIAVSGVWIVKHRDDFNWLLAEEKAERLSVTWINHTLTHPFDDDKGIEGNFLLSPGVDFEKEVLGNEILLIENGITPSSFFRFPGLVSDNTLLEKLRRLTLIPIGASAWLGKGEEAKTGGIILVHGNGNEPEGVKRLLEFYKKEKTGIENGKLRLHPLKDAF